MKKTYVLDTNVLLQSPAAMESFEENAVVLPLATLEELDGLKNADGEAGANARQAIRRLEALRQQGSLVEGVATPGGGVLRLEMNYRNIEVPPGFDTEKPDNRILRVCLGLAADGQKPILITKDIVVRIKAQILGIEAQDFSTEQVSPLGEQYTGRVEAYAPDSAFQGFKKRGIPGEALYQLDENGKQRPVELVENQFVTLLSDTSAKKSLLGRFQDGVVESLRFAGQHPFGVKPRNAGQIFLQEALMRPPEKTPLVIVKGPAGTAKTFYALAVGLHQIFEEDKAYRRILVTRPNTQFDGDIGFLPGTEQEKIAPLLRPVVDNLEILVDRDEKQRYTNERELRDKIDELFDRGVVTAEAMNFIRGRSITHTYLVIDEAQNLTPKQAKGIITRAGKGTKIVMLGDPGQIDHPLLDERTNGLSYASERMRGSGLCCQVTMRGEECERSKLAEDASARL